MATVGCTSFSSAKASEIAVISFDDLAFVVQTEPALITVRIDAMAIGQRAVELIMSRVEGCPVAKPVMNVGFSLVQRASA